MQIYKKYIASNLFIPVTVVALTLTSIIWLSQSLRLIDLIINKGLDVSTFLYMSALLIPSLLLIILPVSLFVSVLYIYNRLTSESEVLVLQSAGISTTGLTIPALIVAGSIMCFNYIISSYLLPVSYREFKNMQDFVRNNYASALLQEGVFSNPMNRFTIYVESRQNTGVLNGILVHDGRNPKQTVTYMAQEGSLVQTPTGPKFELINGNIQRVEKKTGNLSLVYFDVLPLDLNMYGNVKRGRSLTAEERYITQLLFPDELNSRTRKKLIAEGHHRIVWPFLSFTLTLVALATLFSGYFNRRGQWKRILSASVIATIIIAIDLGLKNVIARHTFLAFLLYINAVIPAVISAYILLTNKNIQGINIDFIIKNLKFKKISGERV